MPPGHEGARAWRKEALLDGRGRKDERKAVWEPWLPVEASGVVCEFTSPGPSIWSCSLRCEKAPAPLLDAHGGLRRTKRRPRYSRAGVQRENTGLVVQVPRADSRGVLGTCIVEVIV